MKFEEMPKPQEKIEGIQEQPVEVKETMEEKIAKLDLEQQEQEKNPEKRGENFIQRKLGGLKEFFKKNAESIVLTGVGLGGIALFIAGADISISAQQTVNLEVAKQMVSTFGSTTYATLMGLSAMGMGLATMAGLHLGYSKKEKMGS